MLTLELVDEPARDLSAGQVDKGQDKGKGAMAGKGAAPSKPPPLPKALRLQKLARP